MLDKARPRLQYTRYWPWSCKHDHDLVDVRPVLVGLGLGLMVLIFYYPSKTTFYFHRKMDTKPPEFVGLVQTRSQRTVAQQLNLPVRWLSEFTTEIVVGNRDCDKSVSVG